MTATKDEPMTATVEMIEAGGRTLRVAHWRLDEPSDHPPILFFNGIGANIEAVAPLAEQLTERGFVMFDMPGTGESPEPTVPYNTFTMAWTAAATRWPCTTRAASRRSSIRLFVQDPMKTRSRGMSSIF